MPDLCQIHGDAFAVLRWLARFRPCSFHAAVLDPPYGIAFMNRAFDRQHKAVEVAAALRTIGWGGEAVKAVLWNLAWLRPLYATLVPGAYAGIFQGSTTYQRAAFAAELAGFRVEPMIVGLTGQAMAQGLELGKGIDREMGAEREEIARVRKLDSYGPGAGNTIYGGGPDHRRSMAITAPASPLACNFDDYHSRIKDQVFPILLVQKPPEGSLARNAMRWGVGGLNVGDVRIETSDSLGGGANTGRAAFESLGLDRPWHHDPKARAAASLRSQQSTARSEARGRFPGNVLLDGAAAEEVGEMSGWREPAGSHGTCPCPATASRGAEYRRQLTSETRPGGTAARYFRQFRYVGRANEEERRRGLEHFHWQGDPDHPEGWRRLTTAEAIELRRTKPRELMTGSNHPTMKPLELTRWLARLLLPPPGPEARAIRERATGSPSRLLVPFSGVLSEAIGAGLAGWSEIVAIEQSGSYIEQGLERWRAWGPYSEARARAIEVRGGLGKEEPHEGQAVLF